MVVLVSEPVRGRSRATELPCCFGYILRHIFVCDIFCILISEEKLFGSVGSRVFHALFYSMVLDDQLKPALLLVESLIRHNDLLKTVSICQQKEETKTLFLSLLQQVC